MIKRLIMKVFLVIIMIFACGNIHAKEKNKPVPSDLGEELVLEEIIVHYDRMFKDYVQTSKKDIGEFSKIIKPLKEKVYSKDETVSNYQLIDSLYLRAIFDHLVMLENMVELMYSKVGLSLLIAEPEKKEILRKFREKYESEDEYNKLLEKINGFKEDIKKSKEKIK